MADSNLSDAPAPLSFSLGGAKAVKKPALKQEAKETERRDFILAMEGSKIVPSEQPETVPEKQYIIKKLENTIDYRGAKGKKFKPTFCPPTSDDKPGDVADKFELAAPQESLITEYGLQVRQPCTTGANGDAASTAPKQAYMAPADKELMAYKEDYEKLPEVASLDAYEDMPIEEFGRAMLLGMGWKEGEGVGRSRTAVEAREFIRRPQRLGLGAAPVPTGDKGGKNARPDLVVAPSADGRIRHSRALDEKLVERPTVGPKAGKTMRVAGGRHDGLLVELLAQLPQAEGRPELWRVRFKVSGETEEITAANLADLAPPPGFNANGSVAGSRGSAASSSGRSGGSDAKGEERRRDERGGSVRGEEVGPSGRGDDERRRDRDAGRSERGSGSQRDRDRDRDRGRAEDDRGSKRQRHDTSSSDDEDARALPARSWLRPLIRVKIINNKLKGGRLYLKKGTVVDVHPGAACDVRVDETGEMLAAKQAWLETVVPKAAHAPIMVVAAGRLAGRRGRLLEANIKAGMAAVQLVGDGAVERLPLDDIAEYVGAPEEEDDY